MMTLAEILAALSAAKGRKVDSGEYRSLSAAIEDYRRTVEGRSLK